MSNLLFPKVRGLGWTITKNPTFSTEIQSSLAGREVRGGQGKKAKRRSGEGDR